VIRYDEELMDMPSVSPHEVTQLMEDWSHGDDAALATDSNKKLCGSRPTFRI
jgi:hypothetical protein